MWGGGLITEIQMSTYLQIFKSPRKKVVMHNTSVFLDLVLSQQTPWQLNGTLLRKDKYSISKTVLCLTAETNQSFSHLVFKSKKNKLAESVMHLTVRVTPNSEMLKALRFPFALVHLWGLPTFPCAFLCGKPKAEIAHLPAPPYTYIEEASGRELSST